jgi:hypothetical protein
VAQKLESKEERPLQSFTFKNFLAVNTTNARLAIPDSTFYNLENAQPIGFGNLHSINDISAALHDYAADTIYTDENVNLLIAAVNTEFLIQGSTNGKLFAYNVPANTATQINGAAVLSGGSSLGMAQWNNTNCLVIDSTGYYQWPGSGNIVSIGGVTGAPTSGNAIAVYQNRVWIAQGRVLFFSAPGSFTDFTTASGGGSTSLIDPTVRSSVTALFAANGYLYVWGTSSINAISDLYIPAGASPPTPNFTNLNISAVVGTDQPQSIQTYGRLILFANRYGVWRLYGTSVDTISGEDPNNQYQSAIDGTWQYVNFGQAVSGGQVITNNLLCSCFLIKRNADPIFGSNTVIMVYQGNAAGGKWWSANWGALTRVTTAFVNQAPALFGYLGNKLYQLFAISTSSPPANIQTQLWDFGDPITAKELLRGGIGVTILNAAGNALSMTVDTPSGSKPFTSLTVAGVVQWVNNLNAVVTWQNNVAQTVVWAPGQFQTYWGAAPNAFSKYVGYTVTTAQGTQFEINSFLMDYKWAARWVTGSAGGG